MSIVVNVNGESINYPQIGDSEWGVEATDFAVQTSSAFQKIGLSTGTTVDLPGTLDVTGNTTLDANLSVGGTTSLTGNVTLTNNLTVNGNTQLGNANTDTIGVTGIVNVDAGTLYVDPTNNRVGINKTTPAQALDVVGNSAISGDETIGGTLGVTGDVAINTNKFNITASSGNTTIAGTLGISNGTALAPAITPSGDTNTGLYSIGADKLGFSANGARVGEFGVGYGGFTGNIIQVQNITKSDAYTSLSTSYDSIPGLSISFATKYANSKVLCIGNVKVGVAQDSYPRVALFIDGSRFPNTGTSASETNNPSTVEINDFNFSFYYTATSTSSITYDIRILINTGTVYVNRRGFDTNVLTSSSLTLLEVQQ